ncbi:MAG: FAD-dependent oxidoreductase [Myxococcaceae bacterium]|nr:FAD-dependent oxidoreductase [Myxococcaceae bacterium]
MPRDASPANLARVKRILVVGAGVIGSVYAARLAEGGHRVTLVARGRRLRELEERGLRLRQVLLGADERVEVEVVPSPKPASWDAIVVAVRADQIDPTLASLSATDAKAIAVIGNNLGDPRAQQLTAGPERLVLGFGAFGGVRTGDGRIDYVDGRSRWRSSTRRRRATTLGVLSDRARPALALVQAALDDARVPYATSEDIVGWLQCHAALVLPLAAAINATGGDQDRFCRTRDAVVLGLRAVRELLRALRSLGVETQPAGLRHLLRIPEPLLVPLIQRRLAGESARVAVFGHATAEGGHDELDFLGRTLDVRVRGAPGHRPAWTRLAPWFLPDRPPLIPDGARALTLRPL